MVDTLAVSAKALMDVPQIAETIQEGINTFMEAVPVLMKALDEVAKIHPFISGAGSLSLLTGVPDGHHLMQLLSLRSRPCTRLRRSDARTIRRS